MNNSIDQIKNVEAHFRMPFAFRFDKRVEHSGASINFNFAFVLVTKTRCMISTRVFLFEVE